MHTDLPEPVVPPTSRCGMRARSTTTGLPAMSLPKASESDERLSVKSGLPMISLRYTARRCLLPLGISSPM